MLGKVKPSSLTRNKSMLRALILVGILAWIGLNLLTLTRYPDVNCDESTFSQVAYRFWQRGYFGVDSLLGIAGVDRNVPQFGRIHLLLVALSQMIFGPTAWSTRLISFAASLATSAALYWLGRSMYGRAVGIGAAATYQLAWQTLAQSHYGRPDMLLGTLAVIELGLLWRSVERPTFLRGFMAGVGAVLAFDVHMNGMHFAVAAGCVTLGYFGYRRNWRAIVAFGAGALAGLLYWFPAHLLPDPQAALYQIVVINSRLVGIPVVESGGLVSGLIRLGEFYWQNFAVLNYTSFPLFGAYFAVGLGYAIFDTSRPARIVLAYFLVANLSFTYITPGKQWYYMAAFAPFLHLMALAALQWIVGHLPAAGPLSRIPTRLRLAAVLLPLLVMFLAGDLFLLYKFRDDTYGDYLHKLRELIPPGSTVLAEHTWWYVHPGDAFIANMATYWLEAETGQPVTPVMFETFLEEIHPGYVILDPVWTCGSTPHERYVGLYPLITEECQLVGTVSGPGQESSRWLQSSDVYYCGRDPS